MPPNVGLRQVSHVANLCRRPAAGIRPSSRQLSSGSPVNLVLHFNGPRSKRILPISRIGQLSKATFISIPWARSRKPNDASRESWTSSAPATPETTGNTAATPAPPPPTETEPTVLVEPEVATPFFEQLPDSLLTSVDGVTNIPEHVGFMKEMGLDYGWGPTSCLQWCIENIHVYAGTPWWGTVILAAVGVRLVLLYPYFRSTNEMAKMSAMKPVMDKLKEKTNEYRNTGDQAMAMQITEELREAKKLVGLKMTPMYAPMLIQGVIGYCSFKLLRAMAALPVPGLEDGGFLWMKDLTLSDPFYIMPLAMAGIIHVVSRMGGESGAANLDAKPGMKKFMLYGLPVIFGGFAAFFPGVMQISFLTATVLGSIQGYIFRQPWFRNATGLLPLIPPGQTVPTEMLGSAGTASVASRSPKITAPRKLRVVTPMPSYQPPTVKGVVNGVDSSKTVDGKEKEGILGGIKSSYGGIKSSFKGTVEGYRKQIDAMTPAGARESKKHSRSKNFQQRADAYEAKKKLQDKEGRR